MLIFLFMFLLFIAMYLVNKVVCVNDKLKIGQFANVLNSTLLELTVRNSRTGQFTTQ